MVSFNLIHNAFSGILVNSLYASCLAQGAHSILIKREKIKRQTIEHRRLQHRKSAA